MAASQIIIGNTIKFLRKKGKIPQQELADRLGIDRQYMWKLEAGKINMTMDYLDNIIKQLGTSPEEFHNNHSNHNK